MFALVNRLNIEIERLLFKYAFITGKKQNIEK